MTSQQEAGRRIVLKSYPEGNLKPTDFAVETQPPLTPGGGEFLVRNIFVSVDPMLRLFVDRAPLGGTMPALPLGSPIPGAAVGEIIASNHAAYAVGSLVEGRFGWQDYALSNGAGVQPVNPRLGPPENALNLAGLPGFTAYVGLEAAGGVVPGKTYLVSGAAGAVGSAVGAFIQARGGRAVGIAGGADKCRYLLEEAGYAAVADRHATDFEQQLAAALPDGINVYFDNVGGPLLATVMPLMARGGLVLISGLMAQYQGDADTGPDNLPAVLRGVMGKGVRIQSFSQYGRDDLRAPFAEELAELIAQGRITSPIHIVQGLEKLPEAMTGLFEKSVAGKVIVQIAPAPQTGGETSKLLEESE